MVWFRLLNKLLKIFWGLIYLVFKIFNCFEFGLIEFGIVLGFICYIGFDSLYG